MGESIRTETPETSDGGYARFCCHRDQYPVDEADLLREKRLHADEQTVAEGRKIAATVYSHY